MVNGLFCSALHVCRHSNCFSGLVTFNCSQTDSRGCCASCQSAHREQFGGFSISLKDIFRDAAGHWTVTFWLVDNPLYLLSHSRPHHPEGNMRIHTESSFLNVYLFWFLSSSVTEDMFVFQDVISGFEKKKFWHFTAQVTNQLIMKIINGLTDNVETVDCSAVFQRRPFVEPHRSSSVATTLQSQLPSLQNPLVCRSLIPAYCTDYQICVKRSFTSL